MENPGPSSGLPDPSTCCLSKHSSLTCRLVTMASLQMCAVFGLTNAFDFKKGGGSCFPFKIKELSDLGFPKCIHSSTLGSLQVLHEKDLTVKAAGGSSPAQPLLGSQSAVEALKSVRGLASAPVRPRRAYVRTSPGCPRRLLSQSRHFEKPGLDH